MGSDDMGHMGSDDGSFGGSHRELGLFGVVLLMLRAQIWEVFYMMGLGPCLTVAALDEVRFPIPGFMLLGSHLPGSLTDRRVKKLRL
jgi:hypothetical protein